MAETGSETDAGTGGEGPDLSFIPETFKGEDGAYKLDDFKAHFDELASFKAQSDEASALLPEAPDGYVWGVGEEYAFPEGFDPTQHKVPVLGEDGQPKLGEGGLPETRDIQASDLLSKDDPDIGLLQSTLHKHGAKPELMSDLAEIMLGRELRDLSAAGETAAAEKKALGPDAQSRIDQVTRSLSARMPEIQAKAVLDGITSADALRGIEAMLKGTTTQPSAAPKGRDLDAMSSQELIALGLKDQMSGT
jgi:hypothetical protein